MIDNFGFENMAWFMGIVEDNDDPTHHGRIRVRAFGYHPPVGTNEVLTEDLPWAFMINGTGAKFFSIPDNGEWAFGFFADGRDAQHPFVLGIIPGAKYEIPYDGRVNTGPGSSAVGSEQNSVVEDDPTIGGGESVAGKLAREKLENDPEFQAQLEKMKKKYPGLTDDEIYRTIKGESAYDTRAYNKSGATGLFQFMPDTARGLGYTTAQIREMNAADQLKVYEKYLDQFNYRGGPLGIMQAAPAYASASPNTIVYKRGTAPWRQNPGWRGPDGEIRVSSINDYYKKQRV